jgi:PAP2 superfamily
VTQAAEFKSFSTFCFLACYLAFVLRRPARWELLSVTAAALPLGFAFQALGLGPWFYGFGLAAALWAVAAPYFHRRTIHPAAALLIAYPLIATTSLSLIQHQGGYVFDRYILAADYSFGLRPGLDMLRMLVAHPWLLNLCEFSYIVLPVAVAAFLHTSIGRTLLLVCLILSVVGYAGYTIFPAVGSQVAFPDGMPPRSLVAPSFGSIVFQNGQEYRNFMPSLHTAWGVALLAAAWRLNWRWKAVALAYLIPMLAYTLTNGHYLCDLIAGAVVATAVWSAFHKRFLDAAASAATLAGWLLLIRFGLPVLYLSPLVPWLLTSAALALMVWFYARTSPREAGTFRAGAETPPAPVAD